MKLISTRSCSKKLEELEGERKKRKDDKKKKKTKKVSIKVPSPENILEPIIKMPKSNKKRGK